jgi:FkbM family methyltransferase
MSTIAEVRRLGEPDWVAGLTWLMSTALVFDIGLHNGDDTAFYLSLGYKVVGVEADPLLTAKCAARFENAIRDGRVRVINAGLLKEPGTFTFYRNLTDDGWSSFEPDKGKKDGAWEELKIPCITTAQLIAEHGKPFFMKVDIEGADLQALATLTATTAPTYISLELNCADPIVERLIELGYSAFKFVNGETYWPTPPVFNHQIGWGLLRKVRRAPFVRKAFSKVVRRAPFVRKAVSKVGRRLRPNFEYDRPYKYSPTGYPFGPNSSGPFGEQAAGNWLTSEAALGWFGKLKNNFLREGIGNELWWDVHARHS